MADKRISQLTERTSLANNDVFPVVANLASVTNKATLQTIDDYMQSNLDFGVTSAAMTVPVGLSISGSPITGVGTFSVGLQTGYSIPTTASQSQWDTAYTNRITSLTTTGTSGAATLISNVLNIPNYTTSLAGVVPYTGATTNVNLGEFGIEAGWVQFDLSPTSALQEGRMMWNATDGTIDVRLKGNNVTLQVGQEQVVRVVNKTGADLLESEYKAVYISGAQGQRAKVFLAQANTSLGNQILGLVTETITNNQEGYITSNGLVRGINTTGSLQGETWVDGDLLYLSPTIAGGVTNIAPSAPNYQIAIGVVINAHITQGAIFVKVGFNEKLNDLADVLINGVANNDLLVYDTATSLWKNKTFAAAGGVTGIGTTNYIPKFTGASTIGNSLIYDNGTNVGIGTTSPGSFVEMSKSSNSGSGGTFPRLAIKNTLATQGDGSATFNFADINISSGNEAVNMFITATYASGTWSPAGIINVATNHDLQIKTNNTERMRITSGGNVLIDTTTDSGYKLDVNGTGRFSSSVTTNAANIFNIANGPYNALFHNSSTATSDYNAIRVTQGAAGSAIGYFGTGGSTAGNTSFANNFVIGTQSNNAFVLNTNDTERMRITSAGNVGIGTTSPTYKFETLGTSVITAAFGRSDYGVSNVMLIAMNGYRDVYKTAIGVVRTGDYDVADMIFCLNSSFNSTVVSASDERMRITSNGNVGIGTTSPGSLLDVVTSTAYDGVIRVRSTGTNTPVVAMGVDAVASPDGYVGTQNNVPFGIRTNDVNRIWVTTSGNVGIGTTSPSEKLDLQGTLNINGASGTYLQVQYNGGNRGYIGTANAVIASGSTGDFGIAATSNLIFGTGGSLTERMRITSGGNVLINTTTDAGYKLDVNGTFRATGAATFNSSVTATSFFESSSVLGKDIIATNPLTDLNIDVLKYTRKNSTDIRYGYSAEQISSIMPELTDKEVTAVRYLDVHTILISQLQNEIKELKKQLN